MRHLAIAVLTGAFCLGVMACDNDSELEDAGEEMGDAVENAGDELQEAAENAEDAVDNN